MKRIEKIREVVLQITDVKEEEFFELAKYLEEEKFGKNKLILEAGKVSEYLYFNVSGSVRFHYLNQMNEDISDYFIFENSFFSSSLSFFSGTPSAFSISSMEKLSVIKIHRDHLFMLFEKYHSFERLGRILMQQALALLIEKKGNNSISAKEKYLELLENQPEIIKRVPVKYLATFIGIHPNSLSRIRKSIKF